MRKFEFKKTYEEIEIAGDVYKIDVSDQKLREYQIEFYEFYKESQRLGEIDTNKLSIEEQQKIFDETLEIVKKVVEKLLGAGSFEKLYAASGGSVMNMIDLVNYLGEVFQEKLNNAKQKKRVEYLKHKKRNNKKGRK